MVGGMTRSGDHSDCQARHLDDVTIGDQTIGSETRCGATADRRHAKLPCQPVCRRCMIRMAMGNRDPYRFQAIEPTTDFGEVPVVQGTWIDDESVTVHFEHPGVRSAGGHQRWVRSEHPVDSHPAGASSYPVSPGSNIVHEPSASNTTLGSIRSTCCCDRA